jgi:hypothetical protein
VFAFHNHNRYFHDYVAPPGLAWFRPGQEARANRKTTVFWCSDLPRNPHLFVGLTLGNLKSLHDLLDLCLCFGGNALEFALFNT